MNEVGRHSPFLTAPLAIDEAAAAVAGQWIVIAAVEAVRHGVEKVAFASICAEDRQRAFYVLTHLIYTGNTFVK
jgi:hypothetical protein